MGVNNIIYLSEIGIVAIVALIVIIYLKAKHKKGVLKFLGILLVILIAILGVTFVLEKPEMHVKEISNIEVHSGGKIVKPETNYHFQNATDKVKVTGDTDFSTIGKHKIQFEIDTLTGTYAEEVEVNVVDTKAPEIILKGEEEYKQSYKKAYQEPGYEAIDDYEGNLTEKVKVSEETIDNLNMQIIYEVEDSSGNKAQKIRQVTVVDDIPPVITLNGNANMTILLNGKYEEKGAKAKDEKDGDLTKSIEISGKVDTSKEGTYIITYKVSDKSGNVATKKRTVKVAKQTNTQEVKQTTPVKAQNGSNGKKGVIYLTFDDGPSSNITPKILDILKEKNVKATFFILNYSSANEKLVKREYNEGHTVAIHGYSHDYATIYQSEETYMKNLTRLQAKIKASTGYTATITRFPGGSSNTISRHYNKGIMTRLTKLVVEKGFTYFDWNISSGDAGGAKTGKAMYNNVIKGLSKSRANVVLMHDFSSNKKVLDALPEIIDYGIANGYTFERITESTPMVTHTPNN